MAYIYQYHLKDLHSRLNIDLVEYSESIEFVLRKVFDVNLKNSIVKDKYFEFRLYKAVSKKMLQKMGIRLKADVNIKIESSGFIRRKQVLYAIAYPPEDINMNYIHVEFIDSTLIDDSMEYLKRAKQFVKIREKKLLNNINEEIVKGYYIDILEAYIDVGTFARIFGYIENVSCFFIKGYLRRYYENEFIKGEFEKTVLLEKGFDVQYVENKEKIDKQNCLW
ncbi:MAG: hypothetical protein WCZ27_10540 [Tissierellaceae bacterium]